VLAEHLSPGRIATADPVLVTEAGAVVVLGIDDAHRGSEVGDLRRDRDTGWPVNTVGDRGLLTQVNGRTSVSVTD
jgi:hypothetical protein